jgi:hypothetical protein
MALESTFSCALDHEVNRAIFAVAILMLISLQSPIPIPVSLWVRDGDDSIYAVFREHIEVRTISPPAPDCRQSLSPSTEPAALRALGLCMLLFHALPAALRVGAGLRLVGRPATRPDEKAVFGLFC